MNTTIAVLLTVFNRRSVTLNGLRTLFAAVNQMPKSYMFDVYMVDDGSTDGTSEVVAERFPQVNITKGNGGLYWGGGMNIAWKAASKKNDYDYYLWMNDDAELYPNSILSLFKVIEEKGKASLVSGVFEDVNHKISYGGKTANKRLLPPGSSEDIVYMNGNLVLIPQIIFKSIGYIDNWFVHGGGDYDYGLRAKKAGFSIKLTNEIVGMTSRHDHKSCYDRNIPLKERIKILYNKKNNPFIASRLYLRHMGFRSAISVFLRRNVKVLFPGSFHSGV